MDLWNKVKDLFRQAEESSPTQAAIHEMIVRSKENQEDYDFWKTTIVCKRLNNWLAEQYDLFKVLPRDTDEAIDFLDTPSSKGFVIHFHKTQYSQRDVQHLFDYYKERVLLMDYRTQISDRRRYNKQNWTEQVERHYLKPKPDFSRTEQFNQRFGNILIESVLRNGTSYHLKFSATSYKDRLFKDADAFEDLMRMIVE